MFSDQLTGKPHFGPEYVPYFYASGLVVSCWGRVLPPKVTNDPALTRVLKASSRPEGLYAQVRIAHCSEITKKKGAFIRDAQKPIENQTTRNV